jgi:hypothetical protein
MSGGVGAAGQSKDDILAFEAKVSGACHHYSLCGDLHVRHDQLAWRRDFERAFETHPVIIPGNVVADQSVLGFRRKFSREALRRKILPPSRQAEKGRPDLD